MNIDSNSLANFIAAVVAGQLGPLQLKIASLEAQLAEAYREPQTQPQVDTEAQEAAEMDSYLAEMKSRLISAGLITPKYNNI